MSDSITPGEAMTRTTAGVTRWRKRPVVIEARQYQDGLGGGNRQELAQWCGGGWTARYRPTETPGVDHVVLVITIPTREGVMDADPGDWIIKGVQGEFYPCKPEIFAETYEPATDEEVAW
jgi:hypothetical protein